MSALVYFSSASGNTTRFVEGCRLDEFGIHAMRIPLRPDEPELHVNEPYVLLTPTYGGGTIDKAVPVQVKRFLNDERNRSGIIGVIASRSEERRVGKECSSECRSRWSPYH